MTDITDRQQIMLAALASEPNAGFAPVQVQKLFFLLDENISDGIDGPHFNFAPYDYGPFDKDVYRELEVLEQMSLATVTTIGPAGGHRRYALTAKGEEAGREILEKLPENVSRYMGEVSQWVRKLSFGQLVGSIYKQYPDMRQNSIFED